MCNLFIIIMFFLSCFAFILLPKSFQLFFPLTLFHSFILHHSSFSYWTSPVINPFFYWSFFNNNCLPLFFYSSFPFYFSLAYDRIQIFFLRISCHSIVFILISFHLFLCSSFSSFDITDFPGYFTQVFVQTFIAPFIFFISLNPFLCLGYSLRHLLFFIVFFF